MGDVKSRKNKRCFLSFLSIGIVMFFVFPFTPIYGADPISGIRTSTIKDFGFQVGAEMLTWNETLPAGTSISVELRAGNNADVSDGVWTPITKNTSLGESFQGLRYWQYRITLSTLDGDFVPSVSDIALVGYTGELVSSPFRTENYGNRLQQIAWDQSGTSDSSRVYFRVRTSPDGSNWTPWCGPDDGGGSCNQISTFSENVGTQAIDSLFQSGENDMWIQYKAIFSTTPDEMTQLRLTEVEMQYDRVPWEGIRESIVKDVSQIGDFQTIMWTENVPEDSAITFLLRAGNVAIPDETWTEWLPINNGGDISIFDGKRYLQYQIRMSSYDADTIPSISDVTLAYVLRPLGTFSLLSSPYNSTDASNLVSRISWEESLLPQTDIRFQIRTAPDMGGSPDWNSGSKWCGPTSCALTTNETDFAPSYYTESQGEPTNSIHIEGNNDQWMQYATWISNENTGVAPILSSVELTYLVNAPPMLQNVTATPNQDTIIAITYQVKDPDTDSGTFTQGEVIPSFEYCPSFANDSCPQWFAIPSESLREQDSQRKQVNQETYLSYDALWTPSSTIPNLERNNAKIRVTVNDSEGANNTTSSDSPIFILDTKAPDNLSLTIDASQTPALLSLSASDNSPRFMKISLTHDFSDTPEWEPFSPSATRELQSDPDIIYVKFKDQYGNESPIIQTQTLETPINSMSQDTSNTLLTPPEYRVFISFKKSSVSSEDFLRYELFRKEGENDYATTPYDTRTAPGENYLTDSGEDVDPETLYTYKIRTLDKEGNISFFSQEVTAKANGIQDFGEGGGGSDQNPPTIGNVTITNTETTSFTVEWETDELSDSTVEYQLQTGGTFLQTGVSTYADSEEQSGKHRVVVSGLLPNTEYRFKVSSTDPQGNRRTDTNNEALYSVTTNPGPAIYGVAVQSAYNTQATIVWNTNVLADTMIHYSENKQGTTLLTPITISGSSVLTNNHQITLSGLTQGTDYYFEVTSTDSQGNIANNTNGGNYFAFSTTIDTTPPVLSPFQTPVVSNSKAVITFDTDENASNRLRYKKTNDLTFQETPWKETYDRSHYIMIDALSPNTEYEYSFLAKDINQNEVESETNTFQTLVDPEYDHPPLEKIENISDPPHILTDQKAVITFQTDQIASCIIEYGTQSQTYNELPQGEKEDSFQTNHSLHLSGLIFNTQYFYKILCQDNLGTVVESKEYSFQTKLKQVDSGSEGAETIPPTLTNIQVSDITGESAVVSWETDEVGNSLVRYGSTEEMEELRGDGLISTEVSSFTTSHSVVLRGLVPSMKYYFIVSSYDTSGNIATSSQQSFTTLSPSSISSIRATSKQIGQSTITWNTSTPTTSIVEYGNTETYGQTRKSDDLTQNHEIILNNLLENSTYHFRVKGEDEQGNLFASSDSTFEPKSPPQIREAKVEILSDREVHVTFFTDTLTDSLITYKNQDNEEEQKSQGNPSLTQTHSLTLKDLTPGATYQGTIQTRDDSGNETTQDLPSFTLKKDDTPPQIGHVRTDSALSQNGKVQMILAWETDEDSLSTLTYKEGREGEEKTITISNAYAKNHVAVLTTFKPGTMYSYRVSAKDQAGNEGKSKEYITLTPQVKENVVELILKNFRDIFGWVK